MTHFKTLFFTIILLSLLSNISSGQGCSDAGFCTIDSFKPNDSDSSETFNNQIKIGAFFGSADNKISVYGNYLEFKRKLNSVVGIDLKMTTLAQNGNGISVIGLSDIFVNANYKATENLKITFGSKIPVSKAGRSYEGLPLPMDYQASLGTFDLIIGVGYEIQKLKIVLALQQPIIQNDNQFFASSYPSGSSFTSFQSTNKFIRSGDLLLRVSYPFSLNPKLKLTLSALPIYHLANDKYTDELNVEKEINGSRGLTMNTNIYFDYEITKKNVIQVNFGAPFIVRESRPDGLTRSFIANLEYRIKF